MSQTEAWFWTDAINLMNSVAVNFAVRHTSLRDGSAEATMMLVRYALILAGVIYVISQLDLAKMGALDICNVIVAGETFV